MSAFVDGHARHVTPLTHTNEPSEMNDSHAAAARTPPAICETDGATVVPLQSRTDPKQKVPKQTVDYALRSLTAGGVAACAAKTVVAPLDRVKILFQASNPQFQKYTGSWAGALRAIRDIYRADGPKGLFRGHSATLLRIFPYGGIKFMAYEQIRAIVIPTKQHETHLRRMLAGAMAGSASVFATYPLEVIRVRLAFETRSHKRVTVREICRTIYHEQAPAPKASKAAAFQETLHVTPTTAGASSTGSVITSALTARSGLANFYRGFTPTLWGMLPYAGTSFLTHDAAGDFMRQPALAKYTLLPMSERSQKQLAPNKPPPLIWWAELITGALAGFVSQTASYPLEVIRRRMQVGGVVGDGHRLTMMEVAKNIMQCKGWRGFFVGLGIGYVKVVPMAATSFYVYERMKVVLGI